MAAAVDTSMHRRGRMQFLKDVERPGAPVGRQLIGLVLGLVMLAGIGIMAVGGVMRWLQSGAPDVATVADQNAWPDAPADNAPANELPVVVVADSAISESGPPVGVVVMAEYDGGRFVWTSQSGGIWYAANVGTDTAPIAGVFYRGE